MVFISFELMFLAKIIPQQNVMLYFVLLLFNQNKLCSNNILFVVLSASEFMTPDQTWKVSTRISQNFFQKLFLLVSGVCSEKKISVISQFHWCSREPPPKIFPPVMQLNSVEH